MDGSDVTGAARPVVVAISSDRMGRGDDQLGEVLMRSFLHTLAEAASAPDVLICFNDGVKLATEGSKVLEDLGRLQDRGVQILLCGTCLGHFELKDSVAVGEISNMYTISETMLGAANVVNL